MAKIVGYLNRINTSLQGTPGELVFPFATYKCLELPWRGNIPRLSCIPPGKYEVRWTRSPRLKRHTYEILNVIGRAGIRIHAGNYAGATDVGFLTHSLGCPLLGRSFGTKPQLTIRRSREVVLEMEARLAKQSWILEVDNGPIRNPL